ncbi:MAG: hypothetical protein METHP_01890 [Methanoregula sp. SKADARSKE-2]|nr:MAG: hypothetical protein METHP_01890 [Methanoregula sp. SKADARSKE-2]
MSSLTVVFGAISKLSNKDFQDPRRDRYRVLEAGPDVHNAKTFLPEKQRIGISFAGKNRLSKFGIRAIMAGMRDPIPGDFPVILIIG